MKSSQRKIGFNRVQSDLSYQEISDLDGNWSNAEQVVKIGGMGGMYSFRGRLDSQGEETVGIVTQDEQTDFDNELCILRAMNIIQNDKIDKQQPFNASDISSISKLHNMKLIRNDSFQNLNLSNSEVVRIKDEDYASINLDSAPTNLSQLKNKILSDFGQFELED